MSRLSSALRRHRAARADLRAELALRQVDWFAYGDIPGAAFAPWMGPWWQHAGLVRLDGSRRPSYAALAAIPPERR